MSTDVTQVQQPQQAVRRGNGWGVTALVLGILAAVLGFIPLVGVVAFGLGPLAIIFGIIGIVRKNRPHGTAIAGLTLGIVGLIVSIVFTSMIYSVANSIDKESKAVHNVTFKATSTTGTTLLTYSTGALSSKMDQPTIHSHAWQHTEKVKGFAGSTISVTSMNRGTISCTVLVDGKVKSHQKTTGASPTVSCTA